jgi:transcriptional regulator with XRE-family HTH domain
MNKTIHHGRNVKRFRELLGIKQEAFAYDMGEDWNQKKVSLLESKEKIDDELLEQVAKQLKVPAEAIKNFDEEAAIVNIQNNYEGANSGSGTLGNALNYQHCTFNEKFADIIEENKKLYEQLLKVEREKNALLQQLLDTKK